MNQLKTHSGKPPVVSPYGNKESKGKMIIVGDIPYYNYFDHIKECDDQP